jgi:hypothetical protein
MASENANLYHKVWYGNGFSAAVSKIVKGDSQVGANTRRSQGRSKQLLTAVSSIFTLAACRSRPE